MHENCPAVPVITTPVRTVVVVDVTSDSPVIATNLNETVRSDSMVGAPLIVYKLPDVYGGYTIVPFANAP